METILDMIGDNLTVGEICRRFNISKDTFSKFRRTHPAVQEAMDAKKSRRDTAADGWQEGA